MDEILANVAAHYGGVLARYGPTPRGVDWKCTATQNLRFVQLLRHIDLRDSCSLLDFGCGYGALLAFIDEHRPGSAIAYCGTDISTAMIDAARDRWRDDPRATFVAASRCPHVADYALASGVFNVKLDCSADRWEAYVENILTDLAAHSRRAFAINFLEARPHDVSPGLYRARPERWIGFCRDRLGCPVELLRGYGLPEFTLFVRTNSRTTT